METNRNSNTDSKSCQQDNNNAAHIKYIEVLKRYAAGAISARQAAAFMEAGASEHDVYVRLVQSGLHLPLPPKTVIDAQVQRAINLFG